MCSTPAPDARPPQRSPQPCGPDLAFADAFATALLAAGTAGFDAITGTGYEALIVTPDHVVLHTDAFPFSR